MAAKNKESFLEFKNNLWTAIISCPIVYINHFHYHYIDEALREVLQDGGISPEAVMEFDSGRGTVVSFESKSKDTSMKKINGVKDLLSKLLSHSEELEDVESEHPVQKQIFLFKGLKGLYGENVDYELVSLLESFATQYEDGKYDDMTTVVIVGSREVSDLPLSLRRFVTVLEIKPPTTDEIERYIKGLFPKTDFSVISVQRTLDDLVRTLQGLQMYEIKQTLKTVFALKGSLTDRVTKKALKEKKRIVKKSGIIEVIDTNVRFDQIGGLQRLRKDLEVKSRIYGNLGDAEKYKVPIPKGILIIGMPGCGKSMIAKATANLFNVSLLRLDVSRLMGKYVGESEANLRLALATAEAAHPCVLWIDEIEKAFAGGNGKSGDNDMLVMRMMGHFLTWMQERNTPVYIVATANDVMRPEFMRKGRFDEVYFVNFPTEEERAQILQVKIKEYTDSKDSIFDFSEIGDCKDVVKDMKGEYGGFSGAEIECVLNMVVEKRFQDYIKQKNAAGNQKFVASAIKVKKEDFNDAVKLIKDSVMANQKSKKKREDDYLREKTSIERIRDMQDTYKFADASEESDKNTK